MLKHSLKIFHQVCQSGSFTKAAAKLYVTPSAVMQQIDALEREYGTCLFIRTRKGVKPTAAGEYLLEKTEDLMRQADEIRSRLSVIAQGDDTICVGASILTKCRLLYDLWTLYSQKKPACRIEMVNVHTDGIIPDAVDLIESPNGGVAWMRKWDFLEICRVPLGIAMESTHPLAGKRLLEPGDLAGQEVASFRDTNYDGHARLRQELEGRGVRIVWMDMPSPSVFWECAFQHRLLLAPLCWNDILAGLALRPVRWDFALPYGIFSRPAVRDGVAQFLRFVRETYAGDNPDDIVPVLNY